MLAAAGQALIDALKGNRNIQPVVRLVERMPQLEVEELLKKYAADAPAFYVLPGSLTVDEDCVIVTIPVAAVVRNVGGAEAALAGDGQDIGVDQLLVLGARAIHGHDLGGCNWNLVRAEMEDDTLFDQAGVAAICMYFQSSRIELAADWLLADLDNFKLLHADIDIPPHEAANTEYASWLQVPANYAASRPELQADVQLPGAD
ncbi:MAG: hypothetical protein HYX47_10245 [Burkholderiales bacterium]|nr:hypothetical protein [Burkholderiales bacterium]